MDVQLYIVDARMLVHRDPQCPAVPLLGHQRRVPVTRNQVLVHRRKMPPCDYCWPDLREFEATIIRSENSWPAARTNR